jgi:hypothetical protein
VTGAAVKIRELMHKTFASALAALLLLSACATTQPVPARPYETSIYQAAVFRPENLRPLKPVMPDANGEVVVSTITNSKFPWSTGPQKLGYSPWVTVVPEVKDKCRAYKGADVTMFLRQLIGLKPSQDITQFITFRAKAADLFRPTPDPRIDTVYPCLDPVAKTDCNVFPKDVPASHIEFIARTYLTLQIPDGYPWTHLGYTYNWGPGDRYGASEYLVSSGAEITVTEVKPIAEYCR